MASILIFALISLGLYLPLSPLIAEFGVNACPILKGHGFWKGCAFNFQVISTLFAVTTVTGSLILSRGFRKNVSGLIRADRTLYLSVFFAFVAYGTTAWMVNWLFNVLFYQANTAKAAPVSWVLAMMGAIVVSLQLCVLDCLLVRAQRREFTDAQPSGKTAFLSEAFANIQAIATPLVIVYFFTQLSLELWSSDVAGWDTEALVRDKARVAGLILLGWYTAFAGLNLWFKRALHGDLQTHARNLAELNTRHRTSPERMGALTPVCVALNESSLVLDQKQKLLTGFSKFVSDRMAERILKSDQADLFGHQVRTAIVMTDLRGFTQISEKMAAADVVRMLNIYFQDMIEVLTKHGVLVDKFIGDGLLAYLPVEEGADPRQICEAMFRATIEMRAALQRTNVKLRAEKLPELTLGAGLHFGDVVLGSIGAQDRMQYTIIGESVNKTARLESACKELATSITVSEEFYRELSEESQAHCEAGKCVQLKGFSEGQKVYGVPEAVLSLAAA